MQSSFTLDHVLHTIKAWWVYPCITGLNPVPCPTCSSSAGMRDKKKRRARLSPCQCANGHDAVSFCVDGWRRFRPNNAGLYAPGGLAFCLFGDTAGKKPPKQPFGASRYTTKHPDGVSAIAKVCSTFPPLYTTEFLDISPVTISDRWRMHFARDQTNLDACFLHIEDGANT